jgi:hypothetical protein
MRESLRDAKFAAHVEDADISIVKLQDTTSYSFRGFVYFGL